MNNLCGTEINALKERLTRTTAFPSPLKMPFMPISASTVTESAQYFPNAHLIIPVFWTNRLGPYLILPLQIIKGNASHANALQRIYSALIKYFISLLVKLMAKFCMACHK